MRRTTAPLVLALLGCCALPAPASAVAGLDPADAGPPAGVAFVPGEAIVRFEAGVSASERRALRDAAEVELARVLELPRAQAVTVEGGVRAAVRRLEGLPGVAYAQPNYRYEALAVDVPDDTFFASLWGLEDSAAPNPGVDALEAWEVTRGAGAVIAVVDTGVALDPGTPTGHPDLSDNLWSNPGETPGGGDDDGNGRGDDVHGYDFVDDDPDPDDYQLHGTHVAGTAAAQEGNALGIAGVAPDAEIMAVRVLDGDGSGTSADIGAGVAYAAQEGADVINLSLGGPAGSGDQFMSDAVDVANQHDAVVVAAAGNDGSDNDAVPTTPCTLPQPNLVCVAAVDQDGDLAGFSNFGATTVDVGAPGTDILSTEADYAEVFADDFDSGLGGWSTPAGATPWGTSTVRSEGTHSAADSPAGDYAALANAQMVKTTALNLSTERGCRMHFDLRLETEFGFDELLAGALAAGDQQARSFTGSSGGLFFGEEVSISDFGGEASVAPAFALFSDESIQDDGAYVDDLHVLCRDDSYSDAAPPVGNYVSFAGTSMATPHVAGVAALVRAATGAADTAVASAIKAGGTPLPSLAGATVTGCTVDAAKAIAIAQGAPDPDVCPEPPAPPAPLPEPERPGPQLSPPPPQPTLSLAGARRFARVSARRGTLRYVFHATPPGVPGLIVLRARRERESTGRTHFVAARKLFSVPAGGRVVVKMRLSSRARRALRRSGRLRLRVHVKVANRTGSADARRRLTLRPLR